MLWGLLPCGMVYGMAIKAATTGSPWTAGLTMGVFGLGTAPVLLGLGAATTAISHRVRAGFYRAAGFLILLFGIQAILRGLTALGFLQHLKYGSVVFW